MALLDPYRDGTSAVHVLDASLKLAVALALIVLINLTPIRGWPAHLVYLGTILGIILSARIPPGGVLARSALALPFVLMTAIGLPFTPDGAPLVILPLLRWQVVITDAGMMRFVGVLAKAWLSVLVAITLAATTRFLDLAKAMRSLGMPMLLVSVVLLMYRYLHVLVDEVHRLLRAREARSATIPGERRSAPLIWRARVTGNMIGTLFLRTYERSERIYNAMLARGFDGEIRTLRSPAVSRRDAALAGLGVASLAAVAVAVSVYL